MALSARFYKAFTVSCLLGAKKGAIPVSYTHLNIVVKPFAVIAGTRPVDFPFKVFLPGDLPGVKFLLAQMCIRDRDIADGIERESAAAMSLSVLISAGS